MKLFNWFKQRKNNTDQLNKESLLFVNKNQDLREAFRTLRANLSMLLTGKEGKGVDILCVSSFANEGRTSTAVNLATSFTEQRKKVLLVDADLRQGNVSDFFALKASLGLCDVLNEKASLDEVIVYKEDLGCHVLPCGSATEIPYELFILPQMQQLMEELKARFDYIIYDAPPLREVSDANALAPLVDGVALVCKHRSSHEEDVCKAMQTLRYFKANVLGIIDVDCPTRKRFKK